MSQPLVSVVMSVYNSEGYLSDAVESVLNQSFKDFEFIIIDDGSSDGGPQILQKFAAKDKRIKILAQKNTGLVASLNRGIKEAKGDFIARQDADDKSAPGRFKRQIDFLKTNPDVVIVGSSISVMDKKGQVTHRHALLINDTELRQELLVRSPFAHGSVMFKRQSAIDAGLYYQTTWPAEDYDLWLRLSNYGQLANLDDYLYLYREHGKGISNENLSLQKNKLKEVQARAWTMRDKLMPKDKIKLDFYKNLDMGQLRIERIIDNSVFVSKQAWRHGQKSQAWKNISLLAGDRNVYRKTAGKIKRRIKHGNG